MLLWQVLQVPLWNHAEQRLSHQQMPGAPTALVLKQKRLPRTHALKQQQGLQFCT